MTLDDLKRKEVSTTNLQDKLPNKCMPESLTSEEREPEKPEQPLGAVSKAEMNETYLSIVGNSVDDQPHQKETIVGKVKFPSIVGKLRVVQCIQSMQSMVILSGNNDLEYINAGQIVDKEYDPLMERIATAQISVMPFNETFSGKDDEDIEIFLKRFNAWFRVSNLPTDSKGARLGIQMRGRAAKAIHSLKDKDYDSYDKVSQCLLRKFRKGLADQLASKEAIDRVNYHKCGSFMKFMDEISDLTREAFPEMDGDELDRRIFESAMRLLPIDFSIAMKRRGVRNLDKLLEFGPEEDAVQKQLEIIGSRQKQLVCAVQEEDEYSDELANYVDSRGNDQRNFPRVPQEPRRVNTLPRGPNPRYCFKCKQPGHIAVNCRNEYATRAEFQQSRSQEFQEQRYQPSPERNFTRNLNYPPVCYNCQYPGHIARNCPENFEEEYDQGQDVPPMGVPQGFLNQFANMGFYPQVPYAMQMPVPYGYLQAQGQFQGVLQNGQVTYPQNSALQLPQSQQEKGQPNSQPRKPGDAINAMREQSNTLAALRHWEKGPSEEMPVVKRLAVIPVKINGVPMTALFDTGASVTLASRSIADIAGIELQENDQKFQSVTGHIAKLSKKGMAAVSIGNHTRLVEINMADDDHLGLNNPYDLILGMKTLIEFPPLTVDAKRGKLKINDNVGMELNFGTKDELAGETVMSSMEVLRATRETFRRRGIKKRRLCYKCREYDHIAADCPGRNVESDRHQLNTQPQQNREKSIPRQRDGRFVRVTCDKCDGKGYLEIDPNQRMTFREWEELRHSIFPGDCAKRP